MSHHGSVQLRRYLGARRAGQSIAEAMALSEIGRAEADLIEKDEVRGLLSEIIGIDPAAAGSAAIPQGDTSMSKHDAVHEVPENEDPLMELAAETLRGDTRDALLGWFKAQPKSWPFMAEREQRDLADAADRFARNLIRQACQIIAAGERPTIVAKLVQYGEKDGVEAKLKLPSTGECVAALHEACGREVLLVTSGAEEFMEERGGPVIDADQPGLTGLGDEYADQ